MAQSKCPKCDATSFEIMENSPKNSNFKIIFIQCSNCGCVVGTMDYFNLGAKINELEQKVTALNTGVVNVNNALITLDSTINNNDKVIVQNLAVIDNDIKRTETDVINFYNYVKGKLK